jgi:very-short-patch-repair endonuclease
MASTRSTDRELIATTSSLVEFLRDVALARRRRIVDVAEYDNVLWLHDLPTEVSVDPEAGPAEAVFAIPRLRAEAPPEPPAALTNWLDKQALTDSSADAPVLKEAGPAWVVIEQPDGSKGMLVKVVSRAEAPEVDQAYASWLPAWQAWAARDRHEAPFRRWYTALVSAAHLISEQEDQYELVLATGLLTWRSPSGTQVRNHILTSRVLATVDADRDEVRVVVDPEATTRMQDREMLDGEPGFDAARMEHLYDQIRDGAVVAPLVDAEPLAKLWAERALDVQTPFEPQWAPIERAGANAEVRFAPAVVLRRRERASLIGYYDTMLAALAGPTARAPLGLAQLVTAMEADERLAWLEGEGAASGDALGADPLFPLPANPEQMRIIQRLRANNGVVVQGPPGTGKTHTIANLISALLAQGQRVLVTSQKAQALRVLRDKLPDEVAKLCVSVTDLERGGSAELEASVKVMSNRYSSFDPVAQDDQIERSRKRRTDLVSRVEALTDQVRLLREAETVAQPAVAPGYDGVPGEIARRLRAQAARYDWMPVPLPEHDAAQVLSAAEAGTLLSLLAQASPQRADRLDQRHVDVADLPTVDELRTQVSEEMAARDVARRAATEVSARLDGCDAAVLQAVTTAVDTAQQSAALLGLEPDVAQWSTQDWVVRAIGDALAGHNSTIWAQLTASRNLVTAAERAIGSLGFRDVVIGRGASGSASAQLALVTALNDHLAEGGKLRGAFKSGAQRDAEPVLEHTTVDGMPVTTPEHVVAVCAALQAQANVETLGRGWALVDVVLAGGGEPVAQSVAAVVDAYRRLDLVQRFLGAVSSVRDALAHAKAWLPLKDLSEWQELVGALGAVRLRVAAEQAAAKLGAAADQLARLAHDHGAPPELAVASAAVAARDVDGYAAAHQSLAGADEQRAEQLTCDALLERLRQQHPALASVMAETAGDPAWSSRLADWAGAWEWGRAHTHFLSQRQPGREQQLEAELTETIARLRQESATLAAAQAWGHCLRRMTAHQAQALQAYEQHMRVVGKGTGRYADRFRHRAREAMREARDAVPAWIMPLDVVLETLPPVRDSFDVVIVDEASQASLEDLFLLWLAPRVIVVGDDKQCAPSAVRLGELEPIFAKLSSYLPELPGYLRDAYTPRSSLFDLLRTRFGAVIPLREHFRCMPEIIEYSSRQFYADEPLVPLRQFGGDRLTPLRTVMVEGATTQGSSTRLRNAAEAEAIVSQVEACIANPAYKDRTLGVVVLQGTGQVQLIHQKLMERVEPKQWQRRRLRVGTPPDFQGDERDVVFISMVIADKRPAVTGTEWQRRFNVAASRAKDQMWLFHSVRPDQMSTSDLRYSLLSYVLNPPPAVASAVITDVVPDEPHPAFASLFEQQVFLRVHERGFHVTPHFEVNGRGIDLVITGAKGRLAVECDGHDWPGTEAQREADLDRERELARAGWRFWRVRESEFYYDPDAALSTLWTTLRRLGIQASTDPVPTATTRTVWRPTELSTVEGLDGLDGDDPDVDGSGLFEAFSDEAVPGGAAAEVPSGGRAPSGGAAASGGRARSGGRAGRGTGTGRTPAVPTQPGPRTPRPARGSTRRTQD